MAKKKKSQPTKPTIIRFADKASGTASPVPLSEQPSDQVAEATNGIDSEEQPPIPQEIPEPPQADPELEPPKPAPPPEPTPSPVPAPERPVSLRKQIESAVKADGEIFKLGDKILVSAPWGGKAIAEIIRFYEGDDSMWAQYTPTEIRPGWTWESGCISVPLLVKDPSEQPS